MTIIHTLRAGPPYEPQSWWIDDVGELHLNGSLSLFNESWFIRNLGQVKLTIEPLHIEVTWDCERVYSEAIDAAKNLLSELNLDVNVRLNFFYHGWIHENYGDMFCALERLEEIQECRHVSILHETQIRNCSISDIHFASKRIKKGFQSWERTRGYFDKIDQKEFAQFAPHFLMFRPDKKEREPRLFLGWFAVDGGKSEWT